MAPEQPRGAHLKGTGISNRFFVKRLFSVGFRASELGFDSSSLTYTGRWPFSLLGGLGVQDRGFGCGNCAAERGRVR